MIAVAALLRAAWWFLVSWMASGGFTRAGFAVFERKGWRVWLRGEVAILRMPFDGSLWR